jgi:hypothetical protein
VLHTGRARHTTRAGAGAGGGRGTACGRIVGRRCRAQLDEHSHTHPTSHIPPLSLVLTFAHFVKVVSTIVEPKIRPPAASAPIVDRALRTFNRVCRPAGAGPSPATSSSSGVVGGGLGDADAEPAPQPSTISTSDLQLLLTRHGDALDEATFLQLLKVVRPAATSAASGAAWGGGGGPSFGSRVVFLPAPRGAAGGRKGKGAEPQATVEVDDVVDRLLLGGARAAAVAAAAASTAAANAAAAAAGGAAGRSGRGSWA